MFTTNAGILGGLGISPQQIPACLSDPAIVGLCRSAAILACFPRCDVGTTYTTNAVNADDDVDEPSLLDDDPDLYAQMQSDTFRSLPSDAPSVALPDQR